MCDALNTIYTMIRYELQVSDRLDQIISIVFNPFLLLALLLPTIYAV